MNFENWSEQNSLDITNGAVFLMDLREKIIYGDEYLVAQITVRENSNPIVGSLMFKVKLHLLMDILQKDRGQ